MDVLYQDKTGGKTHTLVCHSTPGVKHMHWLRHPDGEDSYHTQIEVSVVSGGAR